LPVYQVEVNVKLADMRKERNYLKTLNESVMRNSEVFKERMKAAEEDRDANKAQIAELEDQVTPKPSTPRFCCRFHGRIDRAANLCTSFPLESVLKSDQGQHHGLGHTCLTRDCLSISSQPKRAR